MGCENLRSSDPIVPRVRAFNRNFSQLMGLLEPRYMGSDLSVVEARVLYEIVQREPALARDIAAALRLDPGYLSRLVARLLRRGFVERGRGKDARERPLSLTSVGRAAYAELDRTTAEQTARMVAPLGEDGALLFGSAPGEWSLRTFRPGDMGLITARQSILYHEGYGWGRGMEALIGEITAAFLRGFKPQREQCWIAERDGRMLGSVFLVEDDAETARLRLLYVEPEARGLGVGQALVKQCTAFAREAGYRRIVLWTHAVLESARRIYAAEGYRIVDTHTHDDFGRPELSESWLLEL